jgi:hypothetical protein
MKRITVWVDCEDSAVEPTKRKIEDFMRQEKLHFTFLSPNEVTYTSKKTK